MLEQRLFDRNHCNAYIRIAYSPNLRHGVTGQGLNDYDAIFAILAEHHYQGWVSIENGDERNGRDVRVAGVPPADERNPFSGVRR